MNFVRINSSLVDSTWGGLCDEPKECLRGKLPCLVLEKNELVSILNEQPYIMRPNGDDSHRPFTSDVTAAILVFQNNVGVLVY